MNILIITQDDPFYLAENLNYLFTILPKEHKMVGCVLADVSPFGKKESFFKKLKKTHQIFGTYFVMRYGFEFAVNKLNPNKKVVRILRKYNIPVIQLNENINSEKSLLTINSYNPDLLVSIAGNQIFKKALIELAPKGCINLHTAMLPKYRGLMPTFWVLKNNEKETGVSVFFVDEGIDSGSIIVQQRIQIENQTQKQLIKQTKKTGMELIVKAITLIHNGIVELIPNNSDESTYYHFPTKQDVKAFKKEGKKFY
jgi:methionyl-tRNA formyltransferase